MIPSTQYIETQVNTYTTQEMNNQMAEELMGLLPRTAYAKLLLRNAQGAFIVKRKIHTMDLPDQQTQYADVTALARQSAIQSGILRLRSEIESEMIQRRRGRSLPPPSQEAPRKGSRGSMPPEPEALPRKRMKNPDAKPIKGSQAPRKKRG